MNSPPHPGAHLRSIMDELQLNVSQVSRDIGITRQQLHNILAGRCGLNAQMAVRLEKAFGSTAETWLALQAAYDIARVRLSADLSHVPSYQVEEAL